MKITIEMDLDKDHALDILLEILDMKWIDDDGHFEIKNGKVYKNGEHCDDRADLFAALRNVENALYPNLEFRGDPYITNYGDELKPKPEVYHLSNENITYKTDLKKIVVDTALRDLCNQIGERAKDKTTLILQSPLSFMDVRRPCSIAITKNWYDNDETIVWVRFDKSMLFASDRIVSHEHPSVIFTKAYYDADMDDCRDIECNDDEISKVLYGFLSEVYNKPGKVIHDKTEEHLRIVYSE